MEAGDYAVTQTEYKGKPAPGAQSLLAFFDVGPGLQLELIQPNEEPSTWREFLDEHGEGVHHLAFNVAGMNMQQAVDNCKEFGNDSGAERGIWKRGRKICLSVCDEGFEGAD